MALVTDDAVLKGLSQTREAFICKHLEASDSDKFTATWLHALQPQVWKNKNGITGWALINAKSERIHVCKFTPCPGQCSASKWANAPMPFHCHFVQMAGLLAAEVTSTVVDNRGHLESSSSFVEASNNVCLPGKEPAVAVAADADVSPTTEMPLRFETCTALPETSSAVVEFATDQVPMPTASCDSEPGPIIMAEAGTSVVLADCGRLLSIPQEPIQIDLLTGLAAEPLQDGIVSVATGPALLRCAAATVCEPSVVLGVDQEVGSQSRLGLVLALARSIARPRTYVGYAAFVVFAIMKQLRVFAWEGSTIIDIVGAYAPWASWITHVAIADVICCKYDCNEHTGEVSVYPISDSHPLSSCNHYVAAVRHESSFNVVCRDNSDLEQLYLSHDLAVTHTVADGDCSIDVMCIMCGEARTAENRQSMRERLQEFLLSNAEHVALQNALVCCQEMQGQEAMALPLANSVSVANMTFAVADQAKPDASGQPGPGVEPTAEEFEAVRWASGFRNAHNEIIRSLIQALPRAIVAEQLEKYRRRSENSLQPATVVAKANIKKRKYCSSLLSLRMEAAKEFVAYLNKAKVNTNVKPLKLPRRSFANFIKQKPALAQRLRTNKDKNAYRKWLLRAVSALSCESLMSTANARNLARGDGQKRYVRDAKRRKVPGSYGLHLVKAGIVREQLFEWFSVMRHSIDYKVLTRFPPTLVELKAKQLVQDYVAACLNAGVEPQPPTISWHWLKAWRMEYRVSFRRPNRKFKVPRKVLEQRLHAFWCNLVRLRQLAVHILGYDLEAINLDQSPFHMNEAGGL